MFKKVIGGNSRYGSLGGSLGFNPKSETIRFGGFHGKGGGRRG